MTIKGCDCERVFWDIPSRLRSGERASLCGPVPFNEKEIPSQLPPRRSFPNSSFVSGPSLIASLWFWNPCHPVRPPLELGVKPASLEFMCFVLIPPVIPPRGRQWWRRGNPVSYRHTCGRRLVAKAGSLKKGSLSPAEAQVAKETGWGLGGAPLAEGATKQNFGCKRKVSLLSFLTWMTLNIRGRTVIRCH